ncbi:SufD family Fe-S cluster assembly protein [Ureaplasma miroungigenitalium]|uniref:SufD family Fe-S cluster assembly protein n=1 Tax=Ureaplasma miroungigenitalium TaxID=1042321 RepID=UPI0021E9789F|nr:SufD family Fe-S cluster assembly protein [Ureaplasma miroungigenitalium]MCV3734429.1 SufD family Fe-S cluster assembly protein [Ureaplasma miroungigenitalium]
MQENKKELIIISDDQQYDLHARENTDYYVLSLDPLSHTTNINHYLYDHVESKVHILVLNFDQFQKQINVQAHLNNDLSVATNYVQVIGFNDSQTSIFLNAHLHANCHNNQVAQTIKATLFNNAQVKGQPTLTIDSNDVKASHAYEVGNVSDDVLFYLALKGFSKQEAIYLLVGAIFNQVLMHFDEEVRNKYAQLIKNTFERVA